MGGDGLAAGVPRTSTDRLSDLPDDILLQILMFLPLIHAVRTGLLSRRWSRFWMQAGSLHIVDTQVDRGGEPGRFERVVDSILDVYSRRLNRARCYFRISISREDNVDGGRLTTWARLAAEIFDGNFKLTVETSQREGSEEDESDSDSDSEEEPDIFELPYFQFAKKITLMLKDRLLCLAFPMGAGVFASLTKLVLRKVRFADGASTALSEVVSSRCPCLVSVFLLDAQGVTSLTLCTTSLTQLFLSCVHGLRQLDVVALKLRVMTVQCCFVESQGAELLISAPLLLTFEWADCCPQHTYVGPTDHLNELAVGEIPPVLLDERFVAHYSNVDKILSHFRRTQVLELYVPICPELQGHINLMEHIVLPDQYTDLNLFVEPNSHMFGMSMFLLLKRCIGLRMLDLKLSERKGDTTCLSSCNWDNPPSWRNQAILFNSLQEIVVSDFSDTSHEVDVVSFILKCAPSLQQVEIEVADGVQLSKDTVLLFNEYHPVQYYQDARARDALIAQSFFEYNHGDGEKLRSQLFPEETVGKEHVAV